MSRRTRVCSTILLAAFAVSACGKDSTEPDRQNPDGQGANQALSMMFGSTFAGRVLATALNALDDWDQAGGLSTYTISGTEPCFDGSMEVEGTLTASGGGAGTVTMSLRQTPKDCGFVATPEGVFIISGAPAVNSSSTMTTTWNGDEWVVHDFKVTFSGAFTWTGPSGSGSCQIDATYEFNNISQPLPAKVRGKVCGHDVSQ